MAQIFEMKFAAAGPANAAPAFFSSTPRKNRPALEVGRLSFELEWSSRPGMWMKVLAVDVVPDIETCPETCRRFMDLCRMSYSFPVRVCSRTFHQRSQDLSGQHSALLTPLPTNENTLMHDMSGTVSLSFSGKAYGVQISDRYSNQTTLKAVVFGRLLKWNENIQTLSAILQVALFTSGFKLRIVSDINEKEPYE